MSYTREVGERLRRVRVQRGMSLQEVERTSGGRWKAAVVGSYERGDRNISATRLIELAEFYGVPATEILPGDPPSRASRAGVVLDLNRVSELGDEWAGLRRYCEAIQHQRGDYNRRVLSIRGEDLRALAVIQDLAVDELIEDLEVAGAVVSASGREASYDGRAS